MLIALRNNNRCHRVICAGYYPAIITPVIITQIRAPGKLLRCGVCVAVDCFVRHGRKWSMGYDGNISGNDSPRRRVISLNIPRDIRWWIFEKYRWNNTEIFDETKLRFLVDRADLLIPDQLAD